MTHRDLRSVAPAIALAVATVARGAEPSGDPAAEPRSFGLGWQLGNGLGARGLDVIALPTRRLAIELQLAYDADTLTNPTARTFALAPAVRGYLRAEGSSPFALVGASIAWRRWGAFSWTRPGAFANVGYAWRWPTGLEFLLGAGIGWVPAWNVRDEFGTVHDPGFLGLNLEIGIRYMFL